jgi:hypothetical protein
VRSLACAVLLSFSFLLAACGGGGSNVPPPPPSGSFTLASLKGQYAFSMSGVDPSGAFIARIGSFNADGAGNIISGLEDVLSLANGQASLVSFTGGTYQVQSNGRGLLLLNASGGGGLQLNFDLQSPSGGFLLQTDNAASTSGTFTLQTPSHFANGGLLGHYAFSLAGIAFSTTATNSVAPIALTGEINADGNGNITGGVMDTNDGNQAQPSGATAVSASTYNLDTNGNGTNFGRGSMSFAGRSYAFYIVDGTHFVVLEEDSLGGSTGDALQQNSSLPTSNSGLTETFVFLTGGASVLGNQGGAPVATVGRFTFDGSGGLNGVTADDNNNGRQVHIQNGSNVASATYAVDTNFPGSGRGTFTFTNSGTGTYNFVFYLISSTQAVVQNISNGYIAAGPMYAQAAGPFSLTNLAGNYVFNWSGVQLGSSSAVPFEEDFIGQYALANSSSNSVSGVIDYVELGLSSNTLFTNVGLTGNLVINSDGTADNKYTYVLNNSPSATIHYQVYFVSTSTAFLVTSDTNRTTAGILKLQAP